MAPADIGVADTVDARSRAAADGLYALGAVAADASSRPMKELSDDELEERIRLVERELRRLEDPQGGGGCVVGGMSQAEKHAVIRQLELVDHLIDNPTATIPPSAYVDALANERARWSSELDDVAVGVGRDRRRPPAPFDAAALPPTGEPAGDRPPSWEEPRPAVGSSKAKRSESSQHRRSRGPGRRSSDDRKHGG